MLLRAALATSMTLCAAFAAGDEQAPVTFSGQGKNPVQVKDATGEVTEVIGQQDLRLNQIPPEAALKERQFRAKQAELAGQIAAERQQAETADAAQQAEAAKAAEEAAKKEAELAAAREEEFDPTPRKVRRKTVRGTRYVATEPVDPALREPENTGVRQTWPAERKAEDKLPVFDRKLPQYDPNQD